MRFFEKIPVPLVSTLGFCLVVDTWPRVAGAVPTTFAQFTEQATGTGVSNIQFRSSSTSGYGAAATLSTYATGGDPIWFSFTGFVSGTLPAALLGQQDALLKIGPANAGETTTVQGGRVTLPGLGTTTYQPFDGSLQFSFFRTTDLIINGRDYGNTLLTVTITPKLDPETGDTSQAVVTAQGANSHAASMNFDNDTYNVTFTSSFIDFRRVVSVAGAFAFSGIVSGTGTSGFVYRTSTAGGVRQFVENFLADLTGTFAAEPPPEPIPTLPQGTELVPGSGSSASDPTSAPVPVIAVSEPLSLSLFGVGLGSLGMLRRRS